LIRLWTIGADVPSFGIQKPDFPSTGCAVVFGASGAIGAATAGLLAERGCDVVLTYRSRSAEAEKLADSVQEFGRKAAAVSCDVTDPESVAAVVDVALAAHGRIHTVVSATGLPFRTRPLVEYAEDDFFGVIQTDVNGFFNIAKATVPALRAGGGGSITAIITTAVDRTVPTDGLSATPKAAVAMMVRMLATEEARHGIRANAVGPGVIEGGIVPPMRADETTRDLLALAVEQTPLGRAGLAEEAAEAAVFLASSKASYITGQRLMVDGGLAT
jgi:NAD(P)-dependent dehydrogenase (short-subunit alcohol dehydrogenase family)